MQLRLPLGEYQIRIYYQGTTAERIGFAISIFSVFSLIAFLLKSIFTAFEYH